MSGDGVSRAGATGPTSRLALSLILGLIIQPGCSPPENERTGESTVSLVLDEGTLVPGRSVEIALDGESTRTLVIASTPGQRGRLVIDARGNELTAEIGDGRGQVLRKTEGNGRAWGLETVSFVDAREPSEAANALTLSLHVAEATGFPAIQIELLQPSLVPTETARTIEAEQLLGTARRTRGATVAADEEARGNAIDSAKIFASTEDSFGETIASLEVGSICIETEDGNCVWEWGDRALTLAEGLGVPRLLDQALPVMGAGELYKGNYSAAKTRLEASIRREATTTTPRHQARAQILLSLLHHLQSLQSGLKPVKRGESSTLKYTAAERARDLFRRAGDHVGEAEANATLGGYARQIGDIPAAIRHYAKVEQALDSLADSPRALADLYNNLGVYYRGRGDHQKALETYTKALEIVEATGFGPKNRIYTNIGRLYRMLGDPETAIEFHMKVLPEEPDRAAIDLGHCFRELGRMEEALDWFRRSLRENRGSQPLRAWALDGEGLMLMELGRFAEAAAALRRALDIHRESTTPKSEANTLRSMAHVAWRAGDLGEAKRHLAEARRIMAELGDSFHIARFDALLGAIEHSDGNFETALSSFERATATYENLRSDLGDFDLRANFFASRQEHYLDFIRLLADLAEAHPDGGYAERAYEVSEQARARSLVDMLRSSRWEATVEPESELLDRLREVNLLRKYLRDQIEAALSGEATDRAQLIKLRSELDELQADRNEIWEQIRVELPRYAELLSPSPVELERIQRQLSSSSALLQFTVGDDESYLFVVTDGGVTLHVLEATREVLERLCARLRRGATTRRSIPTEFARDARDLYRSLLAPARETLDARPEWIVVPDAPLYNVPFEALVMDTDEGEKYLVERISIHYAQSATALVTLQNPRDRIADASGMVAFADSVPNTRPLRGAREEVAVISQIFESAGELIRTFFGDEASERVVKTSEAVRRARWLHFAVHGDFDTREPASSGLVLAATPGIEDGLLTSREVLELELNADLVVLSGCETGLGKELRGEGIVGLTRAFMYAGAQSVVVSHWRVEDQSTAQLMVGFYSTLLQNGQSKADALRTAKLGLLRSEQWSHPYYWAPFVLVGPSHTQPRSSP